MELKKALKRLRTPAEELDRESLRSFCASCTDAVPISELAPRTEATVVGEVTCVTVVPHHGGAPWLEATVSDGTGSVTAMWTGRRRIAGIKPGQRLRVTGRGTRRPGTNRLVIYNPKYELLA